MSHDNSRMIRTGIVHEESADKGPHKMLKVVADGKVMDVKVLDFNGSSSSPLAGSEVLLLCPDDDDGKAYAIALGPPTKDRVDGLKPGEHDVRNHKTGNRFRHDKNGDTHLVTAQHSVVRTGANHHIETDGICYINCGNAPSSPQ